MAPLTWPGLVPTETSTSCRPAHLGSSSGSLANVPSGHNNTGVSLAFSNGMLIVAWTSNDNNAFLNVATTIDGGTTWKKIFTLQESVENKPTLAIHGNTLVIAWTRKGNLRHVNTMTCSDLNSLQFGSKVISDRNSVIP